MISEENRLIENAQTGDVEAFNQLVRLYERRVYGLCLRMLGDPDAAADIAQDTFISAYRKLNTFRGGQFRSWLLRIATNACYDLLRARKRRPAVSLDALREPDDEGGGFDPADEGELPDQAVLRNELSHALQACINQLSEDQRLVVILSDVEGLAYEEIAAIAQINLGTVKSRLSRARARLRELLREGELLPARYRLDNIPGLGEG